MGYSLIIFLLILIPNEISSYPVYGTKRYGRAPVHAWASPVQVPSYYYLPRTHYPVSYYDTMNPYVQEYADEYYLPQDSYPMYYPAIARNPKYDFYQAPPYYYDERHLPRNNYGYYDEMDPEEFQEELQQEEERVQREEALPVGQETWYENENNQNEDSVDDVNAAFLQNLMLYNDAMANKHYDYNNQQVDPYMQDLVGWNEELSNKKLPNEDEDVKELKMLAGKPKKQKNKNKNRSNDAEQRMKMFEKGKKVPKSTPLPNNSEAWINYGSKRNNMRNTIDPIANLAYKKQELSQHGPILYKDNSLAFTTRKQGAFERKLSSSTQSPLTTGSPEKDSRGGQKEVVLMRPATPVRRPFSEPVMELLAKQNGPERKRTPNVYETIKHLLEMEKNLEKVGLEKCRNNFCKM